MRYSSQLDWMRCRFQDEGRDMQEFWEMWSICSLRQFRTNKTATADYKQYRAENEIFKLFWPQGYFPGHNPVRNYCSQLHNMQTRALAQGMTKEQFAAIWASISVQRNGNSDYAYFVVEKALWTWLWGFTNIPFSGIDPRNAQPDGDVPVQSIETCHNQIDNSASEDNAMCFDDIPSTSTQTSEDEEVINEYASVNLDDLVANYTGDGIEFEIGGESTERTLTYGAPEKLSTTSSISRKSLVGFKDIPRVVVEDSKMDDLGD